MRRTKAVEDNGAASAARARCACSAVQLELDYPAFWAWHDHSEASRRAHGAAYATYVGSWKSRFRIVKGAKSIRRYEDKHACGSRSFCNTCGTPLFYERDRAPKWVNIPRALFDTRTGREPRYHLHIDEAPEWAYRGETLAPLKDYPGVMWERPGRKKKPSAAIPL
ncbi:MAG: GFA family protein [Alphaproteobacteria bacterium]|nr:GFA family protein [Alphaproteobacteria bacterium]